MVRVSPQETYDIFNTNVFGTLNMTRAVLPFMRQQHSGIIANFGSLIGWYGVPAGALYGATKSTVSVISESLVPELAEFGITATVIEAGYFRTSIFNDGVKVSPALRMKEYEDTAVGQVRQMLNKMNEHQQGDVRKGAEVIVDVLTKSGVAKGKEIPMRLILGSDCQAGIRKKISDTLPLLDEWKVISESTDYHNGS